MEHEAGAELDLTLPSEPASVAVARRAVERVAAAHGFEAGDVGLAVTEAVTNAVLHAYPKGRSGTIRVLAHATPDGLEVEVLDSGSGMRLNSTSRGLGVGIALITRLATDASFSSSERGTRVRMTFAGAAQGAPVS
ncbi:MAG TPA: ATP-binding protein [Solirubrobacterales bacterium]|jgi:serine/threonine-protein kinase RsbW/stage II sporulation protein AB (anti-sigma F factor)